MVVLVITCLLMYHVAEKDSNESQPKKRRLELRSEPDSEKSDNNNNNNIGNCGEIVITLNNSTTNTPVVQ